MGNITDQFAVIYRDFVTAGVPASGDNKPVKSEIRAGFSVIDSAITEMVAALVADNATVIKATRTALNADLAHPADSVGIVYNDGANNGVYIKVGSSGSGSWTATGLMLQGAKGDQGQSFYELALATGYVPPGTTEDEFVIAVAGQIAQDAVDQITALLNQLGGVVEDANVLVPYLSDIASVADSIQAAADVLANAPLTVLKNASTSRASTTTLAADPNLTVPLPAYGAKRVKGRIKYSAGATGGLKYRVTGPAGATVQIDRFAFAPGASALSALGADTAFHSSDIAVTGGAGSGWIDLDMTAYAGANAGTIAFEWAQNASDATATIVKAGSEFKYNLMPVTVGTAFASNAIAKLGDYSGPASSGGHNVITMQEVGNLNSYIETMVPGSFAEAQLYTGNYTVTIDRGTPFVVAGPPGNTWGFVELYSGLSDSQHRVKIQGHNFDSDITIRAFGVAPFAVRPSDIPNRYRLYDATNGYAEKIAKDGAPDPNSVNYGSGDKRTAVMLTGSSFGPRFQATTDSVRVWMNDLTDNSQHILLRDGVEFGTPYTTTGTNLFQLVTFATGSTGSHEYEIQPIHSGRKSYINAIFVDTLEALVNPLKSLDAWLGDSNVEMQIGEDARGHASSLQGRRNGRAAIRKGLGGQTAAWGRDNIAAFLSGLSQPASRIFIMLGVNDYWLSTPLATVESAYTAMLVNGRGANASAPIICLGIHDHYRAQNDGTPYSDANRILYNNRIAAAVAARVTAGDANVFYIDTSGWIDGTNPTPDLRDAVHIANPRTTGTPVGWTPYEAHLNTALTGLGL